MEVDWGKCQIRPSIKEREFIPTFPFTVTFVTYTTKINLLYDMVVFLVQTSKYGVCNLFA
jgi:hypothetical protein